MDGNVATSVTDFKFVTQSVKETSCFFFSPKLILLLRCVSQIIFCIYIKILLLLLSKLKADQLKFTDYRYRYIVTYTSKYWKKHLTFPATSF